MATISFEPNKEIYVIYHANCPDGLCSAAIAYDYYYAAVGAKDDIAFYPTQYGDDFAELENLANTTLYILDFSVPTSVMDNFAKYAHSIVFLDHHDTAIKAYADYNWPENVNKDLCQIKSGAGITWDWFHDITEYMPDLVAHIQDGDLWKFEHSDTRNFLAGLGNISSYSVAEFAKLLHMSYEQYQNIISKGKTINEYKDAVINELASKAYKVAVDDGEKLINILTVNAHDRAIVSALGNKLAYREDNESGIGIVWYYDGQEMKYVASVRSRKDVVCNKLAEFYGGGGHPQAAGFSYRDSEFLL